MKRSRVIGILSAAAVAAVVSTAQGQNVYSLNIVSYCNVKIDPTYYSRYWQIGNATNCAGFFLAGHRSTARHDGTLSFVFDGMRHGEFFSTSADVARFKLRPFRIWLSPLFAGLFAFLPGVLMLGAWLAFGRGRKAEGSCV